jgi:hypothetical protein
LELANRSGSPFLGVITSYSELLSFFEIVPESLLLDGSFSRLAIYMKSMFSFAGIFSFPFSKCCLPPSPTTFRLELYTKIFTWEG